MTHLVNRAICFVKPTDFGDFEFIVDPEPIEYTLERIIALVT